MTLKEHTASGGFRTDGDISAAANGARNPTRELEALRAASDRGVLKCASLVACFFLRLDKNRFLRRLTLRG